MIVRIIRDTVTANIKPNVARVVRVYDHRVPNGITEDLFTEAGQILGASGVATPGVVSPPTVEGQILIARLGNALKMAWESVDLSQLTQTAVKTAAYTAAANDHVIVNTSGASADIPITLPSSPTNGTKVRVSVVAGHATYKATINRNGSLVMGGTSTTAYSLQVAGDSIYLEYTGSTLGWIVFGNIYESLIIPQKSKSAAYTTIITDAGAHILHPSADTTARTFTIDSNANVPYKIGTAITFINQNGAGTLTIAITSDTMRLAGAGTTGSRTLAANGIATAIKITSTEWIISGTGLT